MAAPSAVVLKCGACGQEAPHRVLRGRVAGRDEVVFEGVVKCSACGSVRNIVTREPKPIDVPLVVSWMAKSVRETREMGRDEDIKVRASLGLGKERFRVHRFRVAHRTLSFGSATADDIVRMYGRVVRE